MISKWITINHEIKPNFYVRFKKSFYLENTENVIIDISADDYYKLYINGCFVGQGPAPSYDFDYAYNRYDISDYLVVGENVIEAVVYYQGLINRVWVSGDKKLGLVADIYYDNQFVFGTDDSWSYEIINNFVGTKTVGYDTDFLEDRDFRLADSMPKNAVISDNIYTFEKAPMPSLEVYSKKVQPKDNVYDFGEEYVGNLKITANGSGSLIIRYAEELENAKPKYNLRANCDYEEKIILNGEEITFETYNYKGFRYVELITDNAEIIDLELLIQHYPYLTNDKKINTDNEDLKAVFGLCKSTIKYGVQEGFIDCPTREKGQYIGDAFISGFAHLILTNDNTLLKRAIKSVANSIKYSGKILAVTNCAYQQEIADYTLLYPLMLLRYFGYTNDKDFLLEMVPTCDYILNYYSKFENENGLLKNAEEQWNLVDWPENLRDNYEFSAVHNVINAFYFSAISSTEKIKDILGIHYEPKADKLRLAFNNEFLKNGLYTDNKNTNHSSIHANMLPLAFGITDDKNVADYLISRGMECGTYMSYFYLKALCNANKNDEALEFITSKGDHSWMNMLSQGATRCFEAWGKEQKWNTSLFHPWSTAPIIILAEEFGLI